MPSQALIPFLNAFRCGFTFDFNFKLISKGNNFMNVQDHELKKACSYYGWDIEQLKDSCGHYGWENIYAQFSMTSTLKRAFIQKSYPKVVEGNIDEGGCANHINEDGSAYHNDIGLMDCIDVIIWYTDRNKGQVIQILNSIIELNYYPIKSRIYLPIL